MSMELWRRVWRNGLAPALRLYELQQLHRALLTDDDRLIQGTTCLPPLAFAEGRKCEEACALSFGEIGRSVMDAEFRFELICSECDAAMNERAVCRHFLNFFDDTPRADMRRQLLPEVERSLAERKVTA